MYRCMAYTPGTALLYKKWKPCLSAIPWRKSVFFVGGIVHEFVKKGGVLAVNLHGFVKKGCFSDKATSMNLKIHKGFPSATHHGLYIRLRLYIEKRMNSPCFDKKRGIFRDKFSTFSRKMGGGGLIQRKTPWKGGYNHLRQTSMASIFATKCRARGIYSHFE